MSKLNCSYILAPLWTDSLETGGSTNVCCLHTFWYFRRVHAAQHVSDKKAISLHLTQPAVTSKVEPEVRPDHVCHRHSVQEPAGVQTRVVVLDPEAKEEHDGGEDIVKTVTNS